jgi:hypothetical protein
LLYRNRAAGYTGGLERKCVESREDGKPRGEQRKAKRTGVAGRRSASDSEMAPQVFEKARNRLGKWRAPKASPLKSPDRSQDGHKLRSLAAKPALALSATGLPQLLAAIAPRWENVRSRPFCNSAGSAAA